MSNQRKFEFGDRVQHRKRPEWGVGSVVRIEQTVVEGEPSQQITVRFPNAGLKRLVGGKADLEVVSEEAPVAALDRLNESDWLAPMAQRKIEQTMVSLPLEARDPFNGLRHRLRFTLDLYRFDRSGRGLVDWAVAQSGLDDPLSRFSRQELEQQYDRWSHELDQHLRRLLEEARVEPETLREVVADAPAAGRAAVQRLTGQR